MNYENLDLRVLAKRLARDVRQRLDAAGHSDIAFDEHWVLFDPAVEDGHELSCLVPVGASTGLPLKAHENRANGSPERLLEQFAGELAKALPNVSSASSAIERYLDAVRCAALREVKAARTMRADLQLDHVSPKPTLASLMAQSSWRDAARHVLALVGIHRLDLALRPEIDEFIVEEADEVAGEIFARCEEQLERQARRADLRARGADLETDETTVRLLAHFGLDPADLLRQAEAEQLLQMAVLDDGRPGRLTLICSEGRVGSTLELEGRFRWIDGLLEIPKDQIDPKHPPKPGYPLGLEAGLPIFRGLVVSHVKEREGASAALVHVATRAILFDAASGRTWSEDRLAA